MQRQIYFKLSASNRIICVHLAWIRIGNLKGVLQKTRAKVMHCGYNIRHNLILLSKLSQGTFTPPPPPPPTLKTFSEDLILMSMSWGHGGGVWGVCVCTTCTDIQNNTIFSLSPEEKSNRTCMFVMQTYMAP